MQRTLAVSVAVAVGLMSSGCSKSNRGPTHQEQAHDGTAWRVSLVTQCEAEGSEYCVGNHGFTVSADRKWFAGPGPEGQVAEGWIEDQDFLRVEAHVNAAVGGAAASSQETCLSHDEWQDLDRWEKWEDVDLRDKVTLNHGLKQWKILWTQEERICFQSAKPEAAIDLQVAIQELAARYYPAPFPDRCAEAVSRLHSVYPEVEGCAVDADCAYFNDLDQVLATTAQFVVTDSCSKVRPLAVANAASLAGMKDRLKQLMQATDAACGNRIARDSCTGVQGFDSSAGEAKCVREAGRNVCRVNPAAS